MAKNSTPTSTPTENRDRNLEIALKQISKEYGENTVMRLGEEAHRNVPTISTGALSLDIALGIGGVPRGRIVEVYGPESSGKTTVCLHIIANAQKAGGLAAFIDTEHALDPQYARRIGVDTLNLLVSQPDCGEDALNIAETLIRSNSLDVLVLDSVAALVPRAEIEGQMGDSFVGLQARLMSQAMRKLTGALSKSRTCMIFTNQIREKIGVMFGSPETTTGGRALKFYSSVRLDIRRIDSIKATTGEVMGNRCRVRVVKNKMAAPFTQAEFDIMYAAGISRAGSILDVATEHNIVAKRGSWFSFNDEQLGQGREQAKAAIEENPDLERELLQAIRKQIWPELVAEEEAAAGSAAAEPDAEAKPEADTES